MAAVVFTEVDPSVITSPATGKASLFVDEANVVTLKLSNGTTVPVGGGSGSSISIGTPPSATSPGIAGSIVYDADFIYVCVATDTWKRTALGVW